MTTLPLVPAAQIEYNGVSQINAPFDCANSRRALTPQEGVHFMGAADQSYHILFSTDNASELQRVIRTAKSWCADLYRILYAPPSDLLLLQRLYDVSRQYVSVLTPDEMDALQLAADAATDEITRRDKLTAGKTPPIKGGYVYLMRNTLGDYKIGCSARPQNRLMTFGITLPYPVELLFLLFTPDMYRTERELHERFQDKRIAGEWFKLDEDDVAVIMEMAA